jgi:outer membrane protein assembly factor BamB
MFFFPRCSRGSCLALLLLAFTADDGRAADAFPWPQFLGPQRNGISTETGLIDAFPADGPREAWRIAGGVGMSGCSVSGGILCTLVQRDGKQWVIAVDSATGQSRWATPIAPAYANQMGDGPRATLCLSEGKVFACSGEGILTAINLSDGAILWTHHPVKDLGGKPAEYGIAGSPLVHGGLVIVTVGAPDATVAAYDVATGKLRWTSGRSDPAGYSSPAILGIGGMQQLVVFNGAAAVGINPTDGAELWRYPFQTDYDCNIATPVEVGGNVFISSGENHGCVLLDVPTVSGGTVKTVWSSLDSKSVLRNEWQTSVLLDGHLYGFDNVGSAGPVTHLTCIDAATGERKWQQPRFGKGNLIAADGKLWITTMAGELVLVRASPEKYEELGRATVMETTRTAPTLADGRLYLRDGREVVCFDVRAKE